MVVAGVRWMDGGEGGVDGGMEEEQERERRTSRGDETRTATPHPARVHSPTEGSPSGRWIAQAGREESCRTATVNTQPPHEVRA